MAGERGPLWIRANSQTLGRGRSGRQWSSPTGNLSSTLLFCPDCTPDRLHQLSLVTGVALVDALAEFLDPEEQGAGLSLKWPNDVMIDGVKVAGILVESSTIANQAIAAVGVGCNLASAPEVDDRAVTCLADHMALPPSPTSFADRLYERFEHWLLVWSDGQGFKAVRQAWLHRAHPIGARIQVRTGTTFAEGTFAGLGEDGALLLKGSAGNVRTFHFGDVAVGGGAAKPDTRG